MHSALPLRCWNVLDTATAYPWDWLVQLPGALLSGAGWAAGQKLWRASGQPWSSSQGLGQVAELLLLLAAGWVLAPEAAGKLHPSVLEHCAGLILLDPEAGWQEGGLVGLRGDLRDPKAALAVL